MAAADAGAGVPTDVSRVQLGSIQLHVARADPGRRVGILLYPTIFGIDDYMRRFAAAFAARGLPAVVWDPYAGEPSSPSPLEMLERSKPLEDSAMVADLRQVAGFMVEELGVRDIGAIGWCFGGRMALVHAGCDPRISAVAAYNPTMYSTTPVEMPTIGPMSRSDFVGHTLDEIELARSVCGPVQVSRPESDFTHPAEYARLFAALCDRRYPTTYEYYPGATHGFSYTPGVANEKAHRLAWANTQTLFDTLGGEPAADR